MMDLSLINLNKEKVHNDVAFDYIIQSIRQIWSPKEFLEAHGSSLETHGLRVNMDLPQNERGQPESVYAARVHKRVLIE